MEEPKNTEAVEIFIRRWQGREGGQERANYVSFLNKRAKFRSRRRANHFYNSARLTRQEGRVANVTNVG